MTRVKRGVTSSARHKKVLKLAKGYRGRSKNVYRIALERVEKGLQYAYRDRRTKKRDFRRLWIQRLNAAARSEGLNYSKLIDLFNKASIKIDRKILSEIAISQPLAFSELVKQAKQANSVAA